MKSNYTKPAALSLLLVTLLLVVTGAVQARHWHRSGTTIYTAIDRSCTDGIEFVMADKRDTPGDLPIGLEAWRLLDDTQILDTIIQLPRQDFHVPGLGFQPHGGAFTLTWDTPLQPGTRVRLHPDTFVDAHDVISINTTIQDCALGENPRYPIRHLFEKELLESYPNVPPDRDNGGSAACRPGIDVTTSTLEVADNVIIDDLNFAMELEHQSDATTMEVKLTSPQGTAVTLIARQTGKRTLDYGTQCIWSRDVLVGEDTADFILDDQSVFQLDDPTADWPRQDTAWKPTGPGSLSDFNGQNAAGTWTLDVCDTVPQRSGHLSCWFLEVLDYRLVSFTQNSYEADEGDGSVQIAVQLSETSTEMTEVTFQTIPAPSSNQQATSGTLKFAPSTASSPGEKTKSFTVPIAGDLDGDETIKLKLSNPTNEFDIGEPGEALLIIRDDGTEPPDGGHIFAYLPSVMQP